MGEGTEISWADHTFNIAWGCTKVSPACDFCYAEAWSKRVGLKVWGQDAPRREFGEEHWKAPLKWNTRAAKAGRVEFVFCSSMADVFEDHPTIAKAREQLWPIVRATPNLVWLLLTKRPENIDAMLPPYAPGLASSDWRWPNVFLGTTAETQEWLEKRLVHLKRVRARCAAAFLSLEPLLGGIRFGIDPDATTNRFGLLSCPRCGGWGAVRRSWAPDVHGNDQESNCPDCYIGSAIDWVIVGGESGPHARPMHPEWGRALRDECALGCIDFHYKQWGEWAPAPDPRVAFDGAERCLLTSGKVVGEAFGRGPQRVVRQTADDDDASHLPAVWMQKVGKKAAGRLLDGALHNDRPEPMFDATRTVRFSSDDGQARP